MSSFDKELLSKLNTYTESVEIDGKNYFLKELASTEGMKSVVWKVADRYNNTYALKLATQDDYVDRSYESELILASKVNSYDEFAGVVGGAIRHFDCNGKQVECIAFLQQWVEGVPLSNIEPERVTVPFILSYVTKFCEILNILKNLQLRHDDLHTGNVLIVNPKIGQIKESLQIKIIDFGSCKKYTEPLKPIKNGADDLVNFAFHVQFLLNQLLFLDNGDRRILPTKDNKFREGALEILNTIIDGDKVRALTNLAAIIRHFETLNTSIYSTVSRKSTLTLADPFDYLSAEQISDDKLLVKLFAESWPWIKDITSPNPVLFTGPRGCGKSMLFRRYSLKALLSVNDNLIDDLDVACFYISCSADLSNRLSIITSPNHAKAFKEEIIHYFNLTILKEIVSTLKIISERDDALSKFGLSENLQEEIFTFITHKHRLFIKDRKKRFSLGGVKPLTHLLELVKFEANQTYSSLVKRQKLSDFTTISFIVEITNFLTEKVQFFNSKRITFLIDDYSSHRIPEHVQEQLNMMIWDRQASHLFKVSSEKYGMTQLKANNTTVELGREYTEVDIGRNYVNLPSSGKELKRFAIDLLNHRLKLASYEGTAEGLIGPSVYSEGTLGKQLRSGINSSEYYHGLDTLSQVCSGDISTLLEIYRTIFRAADVKKDTVNKIPNNKQHSAIASASKNFVELTKTFYPYGQEMYTLVSNFGTLCKKILQEGKLQRENKTNKQFPNETSRIEIDQTDSNEKFTELNMEIYRELVRRAIFIELEPSRGRRNLGITTRLQLRRIYCPAMGLSISKNTAIKWRLSEFKHFLNDPAGACEYEYNTWKDSAANQQRLFDETKES